MFLVKKPSSSEVSRRANGIQRVPAIRVVPEVRLSNSTTANNNESRSLSRNLFHNSSFSVASSFAAISHGKLRLIPVEGTCINDGVVNVFVEPSSWDLPWKPDESVYSFHQKPVALLRYAYLNNLLLGRLVHETETVVGANLKDVADRILVCLPRGVMDYGTNGQAELFGKFSMYNGNDLTSGSERGNGCANQRTIMHELGHNMGFDHSIRENARDIPVEYGDPTCFMGSNSDSLNGHKNWVTGWFSDRAFKAKIGTVVKLYPINDYQDLSSQPVLIRIGNLFIQFSIDKVPLYPKHHPWRYMGYEVTVTRALPHKFHGVRSKHIAVLNKDAREWTGRAGLRRARIEFCFDSLTATGWEFAMISIHRPNRPSLCPSVKHF